MKSGVIPDLLQSGCQLLYILFLLQKCSFCLFKLYNQGVYLLYIKNNFLRNYKKIPSNSNKRPPLYDGLPSVERHRYMDISLCLNLWLTVWLKL